MAHIIQIVGLFLVLCFITAIIIARRLTIQRSLNIVANTRPVKCGCQNYLKQFEYKYVENPFVGHLCRYYESRVFQAYCKDQFYSPLPSNTQCVHIFKAGTNGSIRVQFYHTWSDRGGNFYVYNPLSDVYGKWDRNGIVTSDWGMSPKYIEGLESANRSDNGDRYEGFECFEKFNRKWCNMKNISITEIFCDFLWAKNV